jgi:hypothetical protein
VSRGRQSWTIPLPGLTTSPSAPALRRKTSISSPRWSDVPDDEALAKQKAFFEELGYTDCSHLPLPPWFEARRAEIMAMLEPIRVSEWHAPVAGPRITPSRRTEATFIPALAANVLGY